MHAKRAQAMIEFALCLFAFALILSALLAFGDLIPKTMRLQSEVRRLAGTSAQNAPDTDQLMREERHETVDLPPLAAKYLFKTNADNEYRVHESASMPSMTVPQFDTADLLSGNAKIEVFMSSASAAQSATHWRNHYASKGLRESPISTVTFKIMTSDDNETIALISEDLPSGESRTTIYDNRKKSD